MPLYFNKPPYGIELDMNKIRGLGSATEAGPQSNILKWHMHLILSKFVSSLFLLCICILQMTSTIIRHFMQCGLLNAITVI